MKENIHWANKQTAREPWDILFFVFCFVNDRRVTNKFRSSLPPSPAPLCRSLSAVVTHRRNVREHVQCDSSESVVCVARAVADTCEVTQWQGGESRRGKERAVSRTAPGRPTRRAVLQPACQFHHALGACCRHSNRCRWVTCTGNCCRVAWTENGFTLGFQILRHEPELHSNINRHLRQAV